MQFQANELSILLFISFVVFSSPHIAKITKLPILAVEMILGSIGGVLGLIAKTPMFELAANIGFCYLMFIAGLEVSLKEFLKLNANEVKKISLFYISLYSLSLAYAYFFDVSFIVAVVFPAMSVGLISILYKEYENIPRWLSFTMVLAALGEVISIVLVTIVNSASNSQGIGNIFISVFYLFVFLGVFVLIYYIFNAIFWWYPWLKEKLMPDLDKTELNTRLSLALWMLSVALMLYFDFEIALGAFLAGMLISSFFGHKKDLEHKLSSLGHSFLVPIFFVYVGLSLDYKIIDFNLIKMAFSTVVLMLVFRLISSFFFYKEFKIKCVLIGIACCMPLTLLIAIATLGSKLNLINNKFYLSLVLAALIEGLIFMWLIPNLALLIETRKRKKNKIAN